MSAIHILIPGLPALFQARRGGKASKGQSESIGVVVRVRGGVDDPRESVIVDGEKPCSHNLTRKKTHTAHRGTYPSRRLDLGRRNAEERRHLCL